MEPAARSHATEQLLRALLDGVCCRSRKAFSALREANPDFEPFRECGGTVLAADVFAWDLLSYILDPKSNTKVLEPMTALLERSIVESERGVLTEKYLQDLVCVWQHWKPWKPWKPWNGFPC